MGTTKKVTTETVESVPGSSDDGDETSLSADELASDVELQGLLSELGTLEDHRVRVRRLEPKPAQACETYESSDFSIERVRIDYGPGLYQCTIVKPNGQAKTHRRVSIAAKLATGTNVAVTPATDSTAMLKLMMEMNRERGESFMKWAALLSPVLAAAVTGYFARPRSERKDIDVGTLQTQFMQQMALAKEMFGAKDSANGIETFIKAIELVKDLSPNGGSENDGVMGLIGKALPLITQLLPNKATPTSAVAQRPQPVIIPPDPESPALMDSINIEEQENMNLLTWVRHQLVHLLDKAARGKDFELYGDVLLEELPEAIASETLLTMLEDEHWFDKLALLESRIREHRQWFQELRDYVMQELRAIKEEAEAQERREKERPARRGETITTITRVPDLVSVGDSQE